MSHVRLTVTVPRRWQERTHCWCGAPTSSIVDEHGIEWTRCTQATEGEHHYWGSRYPAPAPSDPIVYPTNS